MGQNLIEQGIYNPEQGTFEGSGEAFGYGAGVGGFVQTIVEMIAPRRGAKADVTKKTDDEGSRTRPRDDTQREDFSATDREILKPLRKLQTIEWMLLEQLLDLVLLEKKRRVYIR